MVARVAEDAGVRALAIKGPIDVVHGFKQASSSVDVDYLVDPQGIDVLLSRLRANGWGRGRPMTGAMVVPMHSTPVSHSAWPCEFDVHHEFPGFLAPAQGVFDALWDRRSRQSVARVPVWALDEVAAGLVSMLHLLRDVHDRQSELSHLLTVLGERGLGSDLADLAHQTSATLTAAPGLLRLGIDLPRETFNEQDSELWDAWWVRTRTRNAPVVAAVHQFGRTPWRRKPALFFQLLWLTDEEVLAQFPQYRTARLGRHRARVWRLMRGAGRLPRAWWSVRLAKREARRANALLPKRIFGDDPSGFPK